MLSIIFTRESLYFLKKINWFGLRNGDIPSKYKEKAVFTDMQTVNLTRNVFCGNA
jgi:hypothetical protein